MTDYMTDGFGNIRLIRPRCASTNVSGRELEGYPVVGSPLPVSFGPKPTVSFRQAWTC